MTEQMMTAQELAEFREWLNRRAPDPDDDEFLPVRVTSLHRLLAAVDTLNASTQHETQATITQWARETFGEPSDLIQIWKRINDEMNELYEALVTNQPPKKIVQECADVKIVLCQIPERLGYNLQDAVDRKMKINRSRKWKTAGDGTGQHIE